jgi:DNA-binding PucR family transcriptional regulator
VLSDDLADGPVPARTGVLLVPDAAPGRTDLLRQLQGRAAIVGPVRPWTEVSSSFDRAVRPWRSPRSTAGALVDTEDRLTALVVSADPDALADLRAQVLAPLAGLRPATAERLAATLRSWLLHQGRRGAVAEDLVVHPQTVRYRMTQLRERYGDRLDDPRAGAGPARRAGARRSSSGSSQIA